MRLLSNHSLANQATFSVLGVVLHGGGRFAYVVLVGRLFGNEALASLTLAISLSLLASLVWPTGLGIATAHIGANQATFSPKGDLLPATLRSAIAVGFSLGMLTFGASHFLGATPKEALGTSLLSFTYSLYVVVRSLLLAANSALSVALLEAISAIVCLISLVIMMLTDSPEFAVWFLALSYVPILGFFILKSKTKLRLGKSKAMRLSELYRSAAWISASALAANGLIQISMIVVYAYSESTQETVFFAAAVTLAGPTGMLAQAISQVLQPKVSSWYATENTDGKLYFQRITGLLTVILLVFFLVAILGARTLMQTFFGEGFSHAAFILQVLLIGIFAFSLTNIFSTAIVAANKEHTVTIAMSLGLVFGIGTTLALWSTLGVTLSNAVGVASGYLFAMMIVVIMFRKTRRRIKVHSRNSRSELTG